MKSHNFAAAVELDGIPVWVQHPSGLKIEFVMPTDFWDRAAPSNVDLRLFTPGGWSPLGQVAIKWPKEMPRIERISPNPARIGDTIMVEGVNLGSELLLNGRTVAAKHIAPGKLTFQVPEGVLVDTHFNLIVRNPESPDRATWPVTFAVDVPRETQPHLVSATFSPTTLRVGDVLTVTFTVRNNLPAPAMLVTFPAPDYTYDESKAGWEIGAKEPPGTLHLRVTSDHPGPNDPGSWPWFFGFDRARLAPGETVTVTGRIRVETPGVHEFRVGLVASGFRFIDDNAFRTKITVQPK